MIVSIINHKGGTGKTTSSINIGSYLAKEGYKTLLIDIDSQSNLTRGLGLPQEYSIYEAIQNQSIEIEKLQKYNQNLTVLTSNDDLINLEKYLTDIMLNRERIIKKLLNPIKNDFDFIIIDNPPALGITALNTLIASDKILIPVEAEYFSQIGLNKIIEFTNSINENYESDKIEILGIFVTKFAKIKSVSKHFADELKNIQKDYYIPYPIHTSVKISESQLYRKSIFEYAPKSKSAQDYEKLTKEILKRLKINYE